MSELDALDMDTHPESVNGMTHACGHHAQGAAMLGIAAALKAPHALNGLCGSVRLMVVPAEELIQLPYREKLRKDGVVRYFGGKPEFMARGFFDEVDLSLMVHGDSATAHDFFCIKGNVGCVSKIFTYHGKAAHAGGAPSEGINAQYAAMLGLQACNNLRETFREKDYIRFHPIMKGANCAVNIIPSEIELEAYVRGASLEAIKRENAKINRALTGAALSTGATLTLCDRPGYAPEIHDPALMKLAQTCCEALAGKDRVYFDYDMIGTGSSDFGDLTMVMPGLQFYATGITGGLHTVDFAVTDPARLCGNAAKALLLLTDALLCDDAKQAHEIIQNYKPAYPSISAYLEELQAMTLDRDAVTYDGNGNATVSYQK